MKLKLIDKKIETKNIKTFIFEPENSITWTAGQYLIYYLSHDNSDTRGKMRFFTISASPFEKNPSITTKIIDKSSSFKKALDNLALGQIIETKEPDGDFVIENIRKKHVFIAGGIGITPFFSIIKQLYYEKKPINVTLFYTSNNEFLFKEALDKISKTHIEFKIHYLNERIDKKIIKEKINNLKKHIFYVSGPDPMVDELEVLLKKLGVSEDKLRLDYFSGYKKV